MYENGHKIGIMGSSEPPTKEHIPPPSEQPEPTGDEIIIKLSETPTKDSTPLPYKPGTTSL